MFGFTRLMFHIFLAVVYFMPSVEWNNTAWDGWFWPLLGWLFMPFTTMAYFIAMVVGQGEWGIWWVLAICLGVLLDLVSGVSFKFERKEYFSPKSDEKM